jgi:membrane protease YdiL (CAAX protease family)
VGIRWYLVALLATPLIALLTLLALLPFSPVYLPGIMAAGDKGTVLLTGLITGLAVALFEELGWTGFATPKMRERRGVLASGLITGLLWGLWHFILAFWASGTPSGAFSWALFLPWIPYNIGVLPVYRVLMGWVYERTQSLLLAILMHGSLTGGLALTLMPQEISGTPNVIWYLLLTAVLWAVVAAVAMSNGWHLSRQSVQEQVA